MEIKHMIIGAVIIGLIIILVLPSNMLGGEPKAIDCGSDMSCFMDASQNCSKATVTTSQQGNKGVMEILGKDGQNCRFKLSIAKVDLNATEFQTYSQEIRASAKKWEGKDMTCSFPMGNYSDPMQALDSCNGTLATAVNETMTLISGYFAELSEVSMACIPQKVWDFGDIKYEVHGIEELDGKKVCHVTYSFKSGESGTFTAEHFFNKEGEQVDVDYSMGGARGADISSWCDWPGWEQRNTLGTAYATKSDIVQNKGEDFCHVKFILLPSTEELPGVEADAFLDTTDQTAIQLSTTRGNTIEKVYGV